MTLIQSITTCFEKYISFSGRAQRSELWWFMLFLVVVNVILGSADTVVFGPTLVFSDTGVDFNTGIFGTVFWLATILPTWMVQVRRLHDIGKSGWWLLLGFIPLIGFIILLVWFIKTGTKGDNEYGSDPLA